jgi:hypothetical protein
MKRKAFILAASLFAVSLGFGGTARADAVLFSGNTNLSSPTTIDTYLVYTSATFTNVSVPVGGSAALTNLGTFTLNACKGGCDFGTQNGTADFTLKISFTDPTVAGSPQLFAADIFGKINTNGNSSNYKNGTLTIDFDNSVQHLTFTNASGSGSFDLSVNDPAIYDANSNFGDSRTVTGQISNLAYTGTDDPPAAVPEPGSIVLLLSGLGGVVYSLRRKHLV